MSVTLDVPYIPKRRLDRFADEFLHAYAQWKGEPVQPPIDVEDIVENHLELLLDIADLESELQMPGVLGAAWFEKNKISVDESLMETEGRLAFTIAHEIGHWVLHRPLFLQHGLTVPLFSRSPAEEASRAVVCRSSARRESAEVQANGFAARLLMPKDTVVRVVLEIGGGRKPGWAGYDQLRKDREFDRALFRLAEDAIAVGGFSNVSKEAMRHRIAELDLVEDLNAPQRSLF